MLFECPFIWLYLLIYPSYNIPKMMFVTRNYWKFCSSHHFFKWLCFHSTLSIYFFLLIGSPVWLYCFFYRRHCLENFWALCDMSFKLQGLVAFSEHGLMIRWWSLGSAWWEKLGRNFVPVQYTKLIFVPPWEGMSPNSSRSSVMASILGHDRQANSQVPSYSWQGLILMGMTGYIYI